jgi:8-hydroxy-5-deazaflavin:NADPH oxidoreductase
MRIGVLGAGNVGGTLGRGWAGKGHGVFFGLPHPEDAKTQDLIRGIGPKAQAGTVAQAAAFAEVVVLATPWQATEGAVKEAGDLTGKVVIDCTNPLTPDFTKLTIGHTTSGLEQVVKWAKGAKVFKAFNQTGFNNMANPVVDGRRAVMFVCGDDKASKPTVLQLVKDIGFEAVDAGDSTAARLLEPFGMLWIHLALATGMGRDWAFGVLRRDQPKPTP